MGPLIMARSGRGFRSMRGREPRKEYTTEELKKIFVGLYDGTGWWYIGQEKGRYRLGIEIESTRENRIM